MKIFGNKSGPDSNKEIQLQPGGAGQVNFLAIMSDHYSENLIKKLTFKVKDIIQDTTTSYVITLNQPLILADTEAVGILGMAPEALLFTSTIDQDAEIWILVGRNAIKSTT